VSRKETSRQKPAVPIQGWYLAFGFAHCEDRAKESYSHTVSTGSWGMETTVWHEAYNGLIYVPATKRVMRVYTQLDSGQQYDEAVPARFNWVTALDWPIIYQRYLSAQHGPHGQLFRPSQDDPVFDRMWDEACYEALVRQLDDRLFQLGVNWVQS
jgi:hypothetical protein